MAQGVIGLLESEGAEWSLTFYTRSMRRIAVVRGSRAYISRALVATGLASSVTPLAKHRDRSGLALVGRKPANGRT